MTGRRLIPLLVLAAATFGCDDQLAPPPSSTGGTTGTGNTAGMGSTGGTGGSSTGGAGGTAGAGGQTGGTGGAGNNAGSGGAGAGGTAGISGNGGSGGASGAGGAGGTGGAIIGACDNPTDNQAIGNLNPTSAREIAASCGESASCQAETGQSFVDCVGSCVQSAAAGLSTACGSCYGEFALCLSAECLGECATDACDPLCETCMGYATCLEELNTCAGRPSTDCFDNT